jgi:hypothetical protein
MTFVASLITHKKLHMEVRQLCPLDDTGRALMRTAIQQLQHGLR